MFSGESLDSGYIEDILVVVPIHCMKLRLLKKYKSNFERYVCEGEIELYFHSMYN